MAPQLAEALFSAAAFGPSIAKALSCEKWDPKSIFLLEITKKDYEREKEKKRKMADYYHLSM